MPAPVDRRMLEAAATWYVHLNATPPTDTERQAWQNWIDEHPAHAQAWARVERLQRQLGDLPQDIALPTLAGVQARRRAVLKTLSLLLMLGATAWLTYEGDTPQVWLAQYRTRKGQRHSVQLEDGSLLNLNTHTALDVSFDDHFRLMQLYEGEMLLEVASTANQPRPFIVETAEGQIRTLNARFSVRTEGGRCRVSVLSHQVELCTAQRRERFIRLRAGQQLEFTAQQLGQPTVLPIGIDAWTRGMLSVVDWPLGNFVAELARYRPGYLGCSPEVTQLRLSGAFSIENTDLALENLSRSLPIKLRYLTRYWVRIEPA